MKHNVVIIPVHNQLPYLQRCVDSLVDNEDIYLIIVDDGSDLETSKWIENAHPFPNYKFIRHDTPMGFSKACNDGIDFALANIDFDVLCLLNSDTEVRTKDWFSKVKYYFEFGDKIAVCGVMSDNALGQTVKNVKIYLEEIDRKPAVYSYLIHGFCYFISKEALDKFGKLDEVEFPHYGSEDDYSLRVLADGWHNLLVGKVFVHHNNATSYSEAQRQKIIKFSMPSLRKRWGLGLINRCYDLSLKAGNYINTR